MGLGCLLLLSPLSRVGADAPHEALPAAGETAASEAESAANEEGEEEEEEGGEEPEAAAGPAAEPIAPTSASASGEPEPLAGDPEGSQKRPEPQRISGTVTLESPPRDRLIIPPYMRDWQGSAKRTVLFPFYFERREPESFERLIIPYYYRRGPKLNADVALGLVWSLRGPDRNTFVLPPFYTHRDKQDWAVGLFPLFATGVLKGHFHTIIPPLLTWIDGDDKTHRKVVGPYYDWKNERARWRGLFPIVWDKESTSERITIVPPVFFRFADNDPERATTVVPPFYYRRAKDTKSWGLAPLVFRHETPELKTTTLLPLLFQYASGPEKFRLVTPLLSHVKDNERSLWVSPVYQRRRGDKNLDGVAPFFFRLWDDRDASKGLVLAPIFFHFQDPANDSLVILPFMGRFYHAGIDSTWVTPLVGRYKSFERDEQTWWVFPTIQSGWTEDSWFFNIHPLVYRKESPQKSYWAIAPVYFNFRNHETKTHRFALSPLYWDFKNFPKQKYARVAFPLWWDFDNARKGTHRRVGFPLYWDFRTKDNQHNTTHVFPVYTNWMRGEIERTLVLNSYFEKKREPGGVRWEYHFFPFFSRGGINDDRWWNVFYGLAGYDRRGEHKRARAFWIPFNIKN